MLKNVSLRAAIVAMVPELARDPDRLRCWIDKGSIRARQTPEDNFAWSYTLSLLIGEFTGHPSLIMLAINRWLRANQPDLLQPGRESSYRFEAEILDNQTVDLLIELELEEDAVVEADGAGGWTIEHPGEPVLLPDDLPLSDPAAALVQYGVPGVILGTSDVG